MSRVTKSLIGSEDLESHAHEVGSVVSDEDNNAEGIVEVEVQEEEKLPVSPCSCRTLRRTADKDVSQDRFEIATCRCCSSSQDTFSQAREDVDG